MNGRITRPVTLVVVLAALAVSGQRVATQREFDLLREWEPEERLALIRHGNDSVVVRARLDTPELGRFLPVLSGNEGNVRRMREIMHEVNSQDPEVWLPVFMETAK